MGAPKNNSVYHLELVETVGKNRIVRRNASTSSRYEMGIWLSFGIGTPKINVLWNRNIPDQFFVRKCRSLAAPIVQKVRVVKLLLIGPI
jgi:hypothetical protein